MTISDPISVFKKKIFDTIQQPATEIQIASEIFSSCIISKKQYPMKRIKELFPFPYKQIGKAVFLLAFLFSLIGLNAQNIANFQLDKLEDNLFRVSIMPNTTFALPNNRVSTMQIIVRVPTGGFVVSNLTNLVGGVIFSNSSRNDTPLENPGLRLFVFCFTVWCNNGYSICR